MPRIARIVVPNYPYHIIQRVNNKQNIFSEDEDREKYLFYIDEYSNRYNLSILSYCLMDNHVHFIAIPKNENSLSKTFSTAHNRYSYFYNKKKPWMQLGRAQCGGGHTGKAVYREDR